MFLDTSFCIDLLREQHRHENGPATIKLSQMGDSPVFISLFVLCELQAGARLSKIPEQELHKVSVFSGLVQVIYPDSTFAVVYGEIEAYLRKAGTSIPTMDLLIAATAKQYGIPIITRDLTHFKKVPELVIEPYL